MANEVAVLIIEVEPPISMTCADAAIPKGTILQLTDPFTVSASSGDNMSFGRIAAEQKISGDGKTKIAVYRRGIFKCTSGGSTVGKEQATSALNTLVDCTANDQDLGYIFGSALETAANGEFYLVDIHAS